MAVSLFYHLCTFVYLFLFGERKLGLCLHVCTPRLHQKFGLIFCNNSDIFEDILFAPYITIFGVENVYSSSEMAGETTPPLKILVTEVIH